MSLVVENYREEPPASKYLAFFDLYLPKINLKFRNLKLALSKNGTHYISFPSFVVSEEADGKKIFSKYFEFSKERQMEFEDQIFNELKPLVRTPISRFSDRRR